MFQHWIILATVVLALAFPPSRQILIETVRNVVRPIIAVLVIFALRLP